MKYWVKFSYTPKIGNEGLPEDYFPQLRGDQDTYPVIPSIGDLVEILKDRPNLSRHSSLFRVKDRMFSYFENGACMIAIIVEDYFEI